MSPNGITRPPDRSSRNSGNKFRLTRPQTRPDIVALRQKVCEICVVGKFCSRKSRPKFTLGYHICYQSIGHAHTRVTFYGAQILCSNFGSRLLRFRDIPGFVPQMPLLHISPCLSPQIWRCSPQSQVDEQCTAVRQFPVIILDVIFENINPFSHSKTRM